MKVPREPVGADEIAALCYDVTGEPVPSWVIGVDPDPGERGPPDYDDLCRSSGSGDVNRSCGDRSRLCGDGRGRAEVCLKGAWEARFRRCKR